MKCEVITEKDIHITVTADGFYAYQIDASNDVQVNITIDKHISASLYITYHGVDTNCNCKFVMKQGSHAQVLFSNDMKDCLQFHQDIEVAKDANLYIGYADLSDGNASWQIHGRLIETGASLHLLSACISAKEKHYEMECVHESAHTSAKMENYCVVKEHGDYKMQATGKIIKGAYQSSSLQATRVLTMSEQQKSEVIPLLLIDENDVKAGHATTVGQPDENQLYYLQTRGLTREQALSLLIIGYMMPLTDVIDHKELRQQLQNDIEKKVRFHA